MLIIRLGSDHQESAEPGLLRVTGLMLAGNCDYWTNINKLNHLLVRMSRNWLASSGYLVLWILERDRLPTFGETEADFFLVDHFFLRLS